MEGKLWRGLTMEGTTMEALDYGRTTIEGLTMEGDYEGA